MLENDTEYLPKPKMSQNAEIVLMSTSTRMVYLSCKLDNKTINFVVTTLQSWVLAHFHANITSFAPTFPQLCLGGY